MDRPTQTARFKTVMVVDDNEIDRYVAENVIRKTRFSEKVVSAESAMDALTYIEEHQEDTSELPEVIFLDINMPEMSGFDFLKRYENLPDTVKKNCIIMMLTTSLDTTDKETAKENKYVSAFLNKPLSKDKLDSL